MYNETCVYYTIGVGCTQSCKVEEDKYVKSSSQKHSCNECK